VFGSNTRSGNAGWTNLFFLDEVTALAAGHRPCFYCRREEAKAFADCFGKAFGVARPKVTQIDARLHAERLASDVKPPRLAAETLDALPDGAMIGDGTTAYARHTGRWLAWSFDGYASAARAPASPRVLTPLATLAVLTAGYNPVWHSGLLRR
jgi:hypothetical protein